MNNIQYACLHQHSCMSLLDGLCSVNDIVKRCKEVGITRAAITDHGNIYSATEWITATKKADILGLVGIEFYICSMLSTQMVPENRKLTHLILIAKNTAGYRQLVKLISRSNSNDCYYYKNRLSLEEISEIIGKEQGNIIAVTGHLGSTLGDIIVTEKKDENGKNTNSFELNPQWESNGTRLISYLHELFGVENVGIEIQTYHQGSGFDELREYNRKLCEITGAISVATADGHYAWQKQAELQRILLCIQTNKTLDQAMNGGSDLSIFFETDKLYLPSREELKEWGNTDEELDNTLLLTDKCEPLDIFSKTKIPVAKIPDCYSNSTDYLYDLCVEGYKERYTSNTREYAIKIGERLKYELADIREAGLADYFLLIYQIVNWCKDNDILTNVRGSSVGSMVNYLLGISHSDPIKYGLIWSRFYNKGRADSLPDVDLDVQASQRQRVIQYLRDEFGEDNVGQIVTFGTLKGRNALKDTCRVLGTVAETEVNQITAMMPAENVIDDELRELAESFGYRSMIQYCLLDLAKTFEPYAYLNSDGTISGPMAKEFTIARSLEGIAKNISVHAGGCIISTGDEPLVDTVPMTNSNKNDRIIALPMEQVGFFGLLKIDVLGLSSLDAIKSWFDFINGKGYKIFDGT